MSLKHKVKDYNLADKGHKQIEWAETRMPVLNKIRERFTKEKPFKGITISATLHVTKETAVLVKTLMDGGAIVGLSGSNPLSTSDAVAAALVDDGIHVYAWREQSIEEYYECIRSILSLNPKILHDDGADMIGYVHENRTELIPDIVAALEETTTGVIRLRAMERDGVLKFPVFAVNDANSKRMFDNKYGTGQSTIDGIVRATSLLLAGKNFVVCGYGWVGRGIASRAKGMGSNVVVTEVDPLKALEAFMDGFRVMTIQEAAAIGDIFVTATGCIDVICGEHFKNMKDGVILANSGHFDVEISKPDLVELSNSQEEVRPGVTQYSLNNGRRIYLLGEGRLVNLSCAEGHPPEVMDMSFANQALCAEYALGHQNNLTEKIYNVPFQIDNDVVKLKLQTMGVTVDVLSDKQEKYINSWKTGT